MVRDENGLKYINHDKSYHPEFINKSWRGMRVFSLSWRAAICIRMSQFHCNHLSI